MENNTKGEVHVNVANGQERSIPQEDTSLQTCHDNGHDEDGDEDKEGNDHDDDGTGVDDDPEILYRDPPEGCLRLRPSRFNLIPGTIFVEYPPELGFI